MDRAGDRGRIGIAWRIAGLALACLGLHGCVMTPVKPLAYDVRDVAIVAPETVPRRTIAILDDSVTDAIRATTRPVPMPRVVLLVHVKDNVVSENGPLVFSRSTVTVSATSVDSGADIAAGSFTVTGRGLSRTAAADDAAFQIVDQVRFSFGLGRPGPGLLPPRLTSTTLLGWF